MFRLTPPTHAIFLATSRSLPVYRLRECSCSAASGRRCKAVTSNYAHVWVIDAPAWLWL
jgi:hypothetical protein